MIKIKDVNSFIPVLCYKKSYLKNNVFFKFSYLFILIAVCFSCISRTPTKEVLKENELTNMTFKQKEHNFGMIPEGKSVTTLFKFSNTGESPLLIKDVATSCGCTVPEWSKEIIGSNENGEIKIVYDAKYPGRFNKTITVFYNGKNSPQQLTIKGEVSYPDEWKNRSRIK